MNDERHTCEEIIMEVQIQGVVGGAYHSDIPWEGEVPRVWRVRGCLRILMNHIIGNMLLLGIVMPYQSQRRVIVRKVSRRWRVVEKPGRVTQVDDAEVGITASHDTTTKIWEVRERVEVEQDTIITATQQQLQHQQQQSIEIQAAEVEECEE